MNEANNAHVIVKKKRHKGHGGAHSAAWKIALADFAMAMMAFFLLMWIIATTTDAEKMSISGYFQNPESPITGYAPILLPNMNPLTSKEHSSSTETGSAALESFLLEEQGKLSISANEEDAASIAKEIEESIASGELEVEVRKDRIIIRIMENGSFPSGSAELLPEFMPVLNKVAKVLKITPGKVTVSGYTDNIPIQTAIYRSNRELSAIRAVSVAEELLKNKKINSDRFVIRGHGENDPVAMNDTNEGRGKNRRVELEIMQGEAPDVKGKIVTIEKDADAKLLPNIEKTDAIIESVFPPITDIDFDGKGEYLESGELGVFDKDTLYNYELKDIVIKPKEQSKNNLQPEDKEAKKKPDDLGVFKEDNKAVEEKKKLDDLGLFKEHKEEQVNKKTSDDLGVYKEKESELKQQKKPDDLGVYKGKEVKDPNDLGVLKKVPAKKPTEIKVETN